MSSDGTSHLSPVVLRPISGARDRAAAPVFREVTATSSPADVAPRALRRERPDGKPTNMNGHRLRVIVVDDHELSRKGLIALLEQRGVRVVAEAHLAADGFRQAVELVPDVLVTDLCMPGMSAIEATQRLTAMAPRVRVLVLTGVDDDHRVMAALLAGACGYVLKDASGEQIVDAIAATARGESAISPSIARRLVQRLREPRPSNPQAGVPDLTPRELAVLQLLAHGTDNRRIAETLHLSQHTVKQYVSSIIDKLQVENRIQAAVRAVRAGLV